MNRQQAKRDAAPSKNLGSQKSGGAGSNVVGIICPPVGIGLTDLPKTGGVKAPPAPFTPASLSQESRCQCHFLEMLQHMHEITYLVVD